MKVRNLMALLIFPMCLSVAQSSFSVDDYAQFLSEHANLSANELMGLYPAGIFLNEIDPGQTFLYQDSISIKFDLTDYEKQLLNKHGFLVTERVEGKSFVALIEDIYHKDLPLFISSDAILYAVHNSYDRILMEMEKSFLYPKLKELLDGMHSAQQLLYDQYSLMPLAANLLRDVDVYINVARRLLKPESNAYYDEDNAPVDQIIEYANAYKPERIDLFGANGRLIDFSQFKPRGHYEDETLLRKYFKAMMWLGRTELYLLNPNAADTVQLKTLKRQSADAFFINKLIELSGKKEIYNKMEEVFKTFIGSQDNVTCEDLNFLGDAVGITAPVQLLSDSVYYLFADSLKMQSFAYQKILSQILMSNPMSKDSIRPASAFMLFGQRFIIDSYVTGSVVYDRIDWNGIKVRRMLPKTLDILFALGNSAAAQLLKPELERYHYGSNLAALRFLIDNYDNDYWSGSIYLGWLNLIRSLNPPLERNSLPEFMQTAAWQQKNMNTQLTSWTELRHDNLLYGKQSYTGVPICSFPYIYVEPVPEFFRALKKYSLNAKEKLDAIDLGGVSQLSMITEYFDQVSQFADTMFAITKKELNREQLNENEAEFLSHFLSLSVSGGCVPTNKIDGWYSKLFYGFGSHIMTADLEDTDYLVADYHTSPADESGMPVGWVAHAGTGPVNLEVVNAVTPNGDYVSFAGPAYSYFEYTTLNFKRLTDTEWKDQYLELAERPDWVNIYLAGKEGESRGGGGSLLTKVEGKDENLRPADYLTAVNYPNPFNPSTIIKFTIPNSLSGSNVKIKIFNGLGELIDELLDKKLPSGNYLIKWDGARSHNKDVASGVYFYRITADKSAFTGKMNLIK